MSSSSFSRLSGSRAGTRVRIDFTDAFRTQDDVYISTRAAHALSNLTGLVRAHTHKD